jgi:ribonuclease Z
VSARELVVLGTASQAPTRTRSHVSALLRLDGLGVLLDCGEGAQRQLLHAGVPSGAVDRICITHAHGDHCLGLPGVLNRKALDGAAGAVPVHCPASAVPRLRLLTDFARQPAVEWYPASEEAAETSVRLGAWTLSTAPLDHRVPAVGYRLVEDDGVRMLPERLAAAGLLGPDVGVLQREGALRGVALEDVSAPRPGQRVAFVMDTRLCEGAEALAEGCDLLVCEATFLDRDAGLAHEHRHLTARQAGRLAREAGARRLVLLHFSQRYADLAEFEDEAGAEHGDVVVARDLDVVPVPSRA